MTSRDAIVTVTSLMVSLFFTTHILKVPSTSCTVTLDAPKPTVTSVRPNKKVSI